MDISFTDLIPSTGSEDQARLPRGLRNNNPLNIEAGGYTQSQPGFLGSDGRFARFETPEQGYAAAENLLGIYGSKHGIDTVSGIINRWAPASDDNPVNAYASHVAKAIGVDLNARIDLSDPQVRSRVATAMASFENGIPVTRDFSASARKETTPVSFDDLVPDGESKDPRASTKLFVGAEPANFNDRFSGEAAQREKPGMIESAGLGAVQGASFGFGDEFQGAVNAGLSGLPKEAQWLMRNLPGTLPASAVLGIGRILYDAYKGEPSDATKTYDLTVAQERDRLAQARETHPIATTAGELAGAIAVPVGGSLNAATLPVRFGRGAMIGGGTGAAYGFGQGETPEERVTGAIMGGGVGSVLGGAGAAALGPRLAQPAAKAAPDVVGAAERLGVQLPKAVASDSGAVQQAGKLASNVPVAGLPLRRASERAIQQIGNAADDVQRGLGAGSVPVAGQAARTGLETYVTKTTADKATALYDKVDNLVNQVVTSPLTATQRAVNTIGGRRTMAALGDSPAAANVADALARPGGLTYEGIKQLRTSIGEMMKGGLLPAGTSQSELKQIYGALTQDLKSAVKAAGGQRAVAAFDRANKYYEKVSARREDLMRVLGAKSDEGVFEKILAAAGTGARADNVLLSQARKSMPRDDWNEVASAVIARIGRDAEGNFSPDRFLTAWGKLSNHGRNTLFGPQVRKALDDIATVSSRFKQLHQYANPSGTGQTVIGGALGAGAVFNPIMALKVVLPAAAMSYALSRPATSKATASFSNSMLKAALMPPKLARRVISREADRLSVVLAKELGVPRLASDLSQRIQGAIHAPAQHENSQSDGRRDQ